MDCEGCILKKKKMRLFGGKPRGHIVHQKMICTSNPSSCIHRHTTTKTKSHKKEKGKDAFQTEKNAKVKFYITNIALKTLTTWINTSGRVLCSLSCLINELLIKLRMSNYIAFLCKVHYCSNTTCATILLYIYHTRSDNRK